MWVSAVRCGALLSGTTPSSPEGSCLLTAARDSPARSHRGIRHWLRSRPLSVSLADHFGLLSQRAPAGWLGECRWSGYLQPSGGLSFGSELIRAYDRQGRPTSFPARRQRGTLSLGASETLLGSHSGGGPVGFGEVRALNRDDLVPSEAQ